MIFDRITFSIQSRNVTVLMKMLFIISCNKDWKTFYGCELVFNFDNMI